MLRIDHVAIACKDVDAMRSFYEQILGFAVSARKSPSRPDAPETTCLAGPPGEGTRVELMPDDRKPAPGREPFTHGISHIAIAVDDFDAWEARLTSRGVRWLGGTGEAVGGGRVRSFLDPEGNMLQIVERR